MNAQRRRWRLHRVFSLEMSLLEDILQDLLPLHLVSGRRTSDGELRPQMLKAQSATGSFLSEADLKELNPGLLLEKMTTCFEKNAFVLQLDICGFTEFSQQVSAMDLALVLHHLFSAFDSTVESLRLFKMDTVGDAYIVAAFLPDADGNELPENSKESVQLTSEGLAHRMLWLASSMLGTLEKYRTKSGEKVQARIGVAAGKVVVGAMGSLQPRVHIMGQAMREAERLEQEGAPGMANVSHDFLREVRRAVVHQNFAKPGQDHLRQRHSRSAFP